MLEFCFNRGGGMDYIDVDRRLFANQIKNGLTYSTSYK